MANVLLVSGSDVERASLASFLASDGHVVDVIDGLALVRSRLARRSCELAVIDLDVPDGDDVALIRHVRRAKPDLPILAVSGGACGLPSAVCLLIAEVFGADATLQKPIQRIELLRTVAQLLRRTRSPRQNKH